MVFSRVVRIGGEQVEEHLGLALGNLVSRLGHRVPVWQVASLLENGDRFQVGFKFVAGGRSEEMEPRSWVVVVGLGRLLLTGVVEVGQKRLHKLLILNE